MGRSPCCDENGLKKGPWTPEEDEKLVDYIRKNGHGSWRSLPKNAGLKRCGKSCRLRWTNYLRPDIKRGKFSPDEEKIILNLHSVLGNKWSKIATHLPGRTDNEIKNYWNTYLRKKLLQMGIDPNTHKKRTDFNHLINISQLLGAVQFGNFMSPWDNALKRQADTAQLAGLQLLQNLLQVLNTTTPPPPLPYVENNTNTISGLLGCQNLNLFEGLAANNNSTNSTMLQTSLDQFQSPTSFVPNSWASNNEGVCASTYKKSTLSSSTYDMAEMENRVLPPLVSASFANTCKNNQQIESSNSDYPTNYLSTESPKSNIFEAWEKLMDDETSETYWKDILELMS